MALKAIQKEAVALEAQGCKMTYCDAYLAIGIVCMFWFIFVEIRDGSDLGDNPITATILTLGVSVFYPIWLIYRLAMWDRRNLKDKE